MSVPEIDGEQLLSALEGQILAQVELAGLYGNP